MKKFGQLVVKARYVILIISILLLIPAAFGYVNTRVNYDLLYYLPDGIDTMTGQDIMLNDFGSGAFGLVLVDGMDDENTAKLKKEIEGVDHVKNVLWYDSFADLKIPKSMLPKDVYNAFNKDGSTIMMVIFDDTSSGDGTMSAIENIRTLTKHQCKVSGISAVVTDTKSLVESEMAIYVIIAVIISIIVLSILMDSWLIPLFFMLSIGMAIVYNLGSNVVMGEISYLTKALAAVLQLAVTMDYSIFLWHSYEEQKKVIPNDNNKAMANAITATVSSIVGSSITTVAGFIALCFMTFTLGLDMGVVMAKGVVFGVIACVTVLPAMVLIFDKALVKTKHKPLIPDFKKLPKFITKHYPVFIIIFLVLIFPAFYGQKNTNVYYDLTLSLPESLESVKAQNVISEDYNLGSANIVLISSDTPDYKVSKLLDDIKGVDGVQTALGLQTVLNGSIPNSFIPDEYWTIDADVNIKGEKNTVKAKFYGDENGKIDVKNGEQAEKIIEEVKKSDFSVESVKHGEKIKKVPLAFTTSTLQQEAAKQLNFATQKTMRLAQQLYEGVDIAGRGTIGIITYLRTDSTRIADEAVAAAAQYIGEQYGEEYVGTVHDTKEKKKIQDAHEAIRPTDISLSPAIIKDSLSRDQFRLYQLIWKRFTASQMSPAIYETASVKIAAGKYRFSVSASKIKFDGFLSVYKDDDEKSENKALIHGISEESQVSLADVKGEQHFTQPPAHFTEASLVKQLEELGIGRPSTYAPTITTIIARHYVAKENKNLYVTELGEAVNNIMKKAFPTIVDVNFTANMETLLDSVGEGKVKWKEVIRNFYPDLDEAVKLAEKELENVKIEDEVTDVICDKCGRNMVIKYGPHGKFLGCPGFPECHNTKPYLEKIGVTCPKCGKDIVLKKTKKGRRYFGCENNPECDFMSWQKPVSKKCPKCGGYMVEKGNKIACADETCGYIEAKTEKKEDK